MFLKTVVTAGVLCVGLATTHAWADDFTCSTEGIIQHTKAQSQKMDAYIANSDNPRQTQAALRDMARGLRESGQVSNHQEEFEKLAKGEDFQPSQGFCDDIQTTMSAIDEYMASHPH